MRKVYWLVGIALLALSACVVFVHRQKQTQESITEISIEHTRCYGTCPIYKIILRPDNTAIYIGQKYSDRIGTYKADIYQFSRISQAVREDGFFALRDSYTEAVTDQPSVITTVAQGKRRKVVDNHGDTGPQKLWEIQTLIDGAVAQARWTKVSSNTAYPGTR